MVSRSASSSEEMAPNAMAAFVNSCAWSSATGATIRAASASSGKNLTSWVVGSDRAFETGRRFANRGLRASIAWFNEAPRAANALPKPSRFFRLASRVGVSKVLPMSSNSVCWVSASSCSVSGSVSVAPSLRSSPSPRSISRYLRPNEDR